MMISRVSKKSATQFMRTLASFTPAKPLHARDLNKQTIEAKYAVRGRIPIRAEEIKHHLQTNPESHGFKFDKIINANIGNPQQLDQKPLTWYRQVLSVLQYPDILESEELSKSYPKDVLTRAKNILSSTGSIGAYSHSQGDQYIRKSVAKFISQRDGHPANANDIFLTAGASSAVSYLLQILSVDKNSGFLIPIPQYPLYTASIALNDAKPIGYFLDESNNWSTNPEEIRSLIKENSEKGIDIKCLVVINPGNPTGSVLEKEDIKELIDIAAEFGIVLIADEVYQENIFQGEFISFKKVLSELVIARPDLYSNVQLASLHSTSKGFSGECGQRGGYMELSGFTDGFKNVMLKLASINLSPVVSGQALMELMINPPKQGDESYAVYKQEVDEIYSALKERSELLYNAFTTMTDVTCNKPQGAMYLFPRLHFNKHGYARLFQEAQDLGVEIDEFYCIQLLENTGICCVPGSGFGQVKDTYHLRTTFLAPGTEWIENWRQFHEQFIKSYKS
ncbi:probable alanine aminotransferase [[Candida] jaroonii]|uniref:Probable alanine aminotransferase n=1 Tax=[Candida] jaroonii TaxID=467808 RepID=A0ACA9YEY0_9ASCO|nr:probable alanine aminotransferase [[Candida] jaroonii]